MVQFSCKEKGKQTVLKSDLSAVVVVLLKGLHPRKPVSLLYVALEAVESVLLIVDCFTFCFLCTHGCQRRSWISIWLNLGLQTRHSFATFSGLFGKRTVLVCWYIAKSVPRTATFSHLLPCTSLSRRPQLLVVSPWTAELCFGSEIL